MRRAFTRWLSAAFDNFHLVLVDVRQHGQAAHVEQRPRRPDSSRSNRPGFDHAITIAPVPR